MELVKGRSFATAISLLLCCDWIAYELRENTKKGKRRKGNKKAKIEKRGNKNSQKPNFAGKP